MQTRNLSITSILSADYTTTASFANVAVAGAAGCVITVPEDGVYDLYGHGWTYINTDGDNTDQYLAINGLTIYGTFTTGFLSGATGYLELTSLELNVALKANDIVSIQAKYNGGSSTLYKSGSKIQIIKRGV